MSNGNRSSGGPRSGTLRSSSIGEFTRSTLETLEKLSEEALEKLDEDGSGNSEFNSAAFSFALSWISAGGAEEDYIEAVSRSTLGASYPRSDLERRLGKTFAGAEEKHDPTYSSGVVRGRLRALEERLKEAVLPAGLRASALALVQIGAEINAWTVDASTRRLAERTGYGVPATAGHMKKFEEIGLVSRTVYNGHGKARTFHIDMDYEPPLKVASEGVGNKHTHKYLQVLMCSFAPHPLLWSKHGLGPTAEKIYLAVGASPVSVSRISTASGSDRKTVRRHLPRLVELDLVIEIEGQHPRYTANLVPDYDAAVVALGVAESAERRRQQYADERKEYRNQNTNLVDLYLGEGRNPFLGGSVKDRIPPHRLNSEGLEEIRRSGAVWDHDSIPERYREYAPEVMDPWAVPALDEEVWTGSNLNTGEPIPPETGQRHSAAVVGRADDGTMQYDEPPF